MRRWILVTAMLLGVRSVPALADPQAMSGNVPVPAQDALVVRTGTLEFQGTGVYTNDNHNSKGSSLLALTPTLKLGPFRHVQIDISAPYSVGNQSSASQGGQAIDAYYQFTDPSPVFPALAVQAGYSVPYGPGRRTNQYFVRGLATQWLGSSERSPRLHLNLNWTRQTTPSETSRKEILEIVVAYSMLVSDSTAFVADVVHGAKSAKGQNQTVIDAGLRWEVDDHLALSAGAGVGVGQQSPAFRILFALQRSLQLF